MNDEQKIAKLRERERGFSIERSDVLNVRNSADSRLLVIDVHLEEIRNALALFDDIDKARAAIPVAPVAQRQPRRDIPELVLDAINARIEITPLLESEAVEYLYGTTGIRRDAITKALERLKRKRLLFVIDGHLATELPAPSTAVGVAAETQQADGDGIELFQDRRQPKVAAQ